VTGITTSHSADKAGLCHTLCEVLGELIDINEVVAAPPGIDQRLVPVGNQWCDEVLLKLVEQLRPCEGLVVTVNAVTVVDCLICQGHSEDNPMIAPITTRKIDPEDIEGVIVVLPHIVVQPLFADWSVQVQSREVYQGNTGGILVTIVK